MSKNSSLEVMRCPLYIYILYIYMFFDAVHSFGGVTFGQAPGPSHASCGSGLGARSFPVDVGSPGGF